MGKDDPKGSLRLFVNDNRTTDAQPTLTGFGEIPKTFINELVELANATGEEFVEVQCASWKRESKEGKGYNFISFEKKWVKEPAGVVNPATPDSDPFS